MNAKRYSSSRKPVQQAEITPQQAIAQLRVRIFNEAASTLAVIRSLNEEAPTNHPARGEINEALKLVREALVQSGLEIIRPIVAQLRATDLPAALKLLQAPADQAGDAENAATADSRAT
jgi:hypothetical protein